MSKSRRSKLWTGQFVAIAVLTTTEVHLCKNVKQLIMKSIHENKEHYLFIGGLPKSISDPSDATCVRMNIVFISLSAAFVDPTKFTDSVALIDVRISLTLYHLPFVKVFLRIKVKR